MVGPMTNLGKSTCTSTDLMGPLASQIRVLLEIDKAAKTGSCHLSGGKIVSIEKIRKKSQILFYPCVHALVCSCAYF